MSTGKKVTPYQRRVLAKLAADGPLTLQEAAITKNILSTLIACGWARPEPAVRYEITDAGREALSN